MAPSIVVASWSGFPARDIARHSQKTRAVVMLAPVRVERADRFIVMV
jgi:hypothetical protein